MKKKLKRASMVVFDGIFFLLTKLIPKNEDLWVFGAWFGQNYSDNPKAFFEFLNTFHSNQVNAIWVTKNRAIKCELQKKGYKVQLAKSIKGIWYQLRAGKVFICQSLHDDVFAPCIGKETQVVQLWHGIPLKKIMFDVFTERDKNLLGRIFDWLTPYNKHRNDLLIATSELTQKILAGAFRLPKKQVLLSGFPRNDVFLESHSKIDENSYNCIYMPTFRGGISTECDLFQRYGFDFDYIESQLLEHNIKLTLRMHPVNRPPRDVIDKIKNSKVIKLDAGKDIYQSINKYDCLITDYSSIYFDFLLSNKPIIFAPFDLEEYKQRERSLYFEFEDVTLKPYCYNWRDVLSRIVFLKNNELKDGYVSQYEKLRNKFHQPIPLGSESFSKKLYGVLKK